MKWAFGISPQVEGICSIEKVAFGKFCQCNNLKCSNRVQEIRFVNFLGKDSKIQSGNKRQILSGDSKNHHLLLDQKSNPRYSSAY